ncbi:hypothetical protein CEXT_594831 [Caerostris extrusa]|uniref:Uncharacterized protein n=1 Tax=Caerostris extrusa TaxID=172846 RepID=A0AAV4MKG3_CAEEX|nr:hypothetical protein CEXT_594831 [Caerostris extrusa]
MTVPSEDIRHFRPGLRQQSRTVRADREIKSKILRGTNHATTMNKPHHYVTIQKLKAGIAFVEGSMQSHGITTLTDKQAPPGLRPITII